MNINNPCSITAEEYFDADLDLGDKDIGRPRETSTKIQKFKANLSLCQEYPLTLQEQVSLCVRVYLMYVSLSVSLSHKTARTLKRHLL